MADLRWNQIVYLWFAHLLYNILYQLPKIKTHFFRFEYLLSMLILLIIIVSTSLIACHDSVRKVPAESLRGDNAVKMKLSFLNSTNYITATRYLWKQNRIWEYWFKIDAA